jgi:hypothetical protein
MWLRRLLTAAYGLEERSAHTPDELDWETLPERCALQLHWQRTGVPRAARAVRLLRRRPRAAVHPPLRAARAGDGPLARRRGGAEKPLLGADPASQAFLAYATGPRAKALLSVTPEWWAHADARTRYEDLVADPPGELGRMVEALGGAPAVTPAAAVEAGGFGRLRDEATNMHFWQGRPGLWSELVPTRYALAIASAHPAMLELGYSVGVDAPTARARWVAIAEAS